jgi:hypothetical protein
MANLVALRSPIRASRATLTASRADRRSTAAGPSAADLARAARSSWAFFASAAALKRSAKLVFLDLFISILYAQGKRLLAQGVDGFRSALAMPYSRAWTRTRVRRLRLSGRAASKVVGALDHGVRQSIVECRLGAACCKDHQRRCAPWSGGWRSLMIVPVGPSSPRPSTPNSMAEIPRPAASEAKGPR